MELAYKYMSQIPPKGKTKFDEEFLYTSEGNISSPRPSRNVAPAAYGESRPPVIYDFTENPFYRAPRYSGGLNIPGAPGNIQTLPYITATPSFEIPGGQSPYRFGPYLPYRGEERKEEETPFIPIPLQQAQGLPMGFQNKYVS
jgi:hypothetical protein